MLIFLWDKGVLKVSELAVSIYRFIQYLQNYIHNRWLVSYLRYGKVSLCLHFNIHFLPVECKVTVDIPWISSGLIRIDTNELLKLCRQSFKVTRCLPDLIPRQSGLSSILHWICLICIIGQFSAAANCSSHSSIIFSIPFTDILHRENCSEIQLSSNSHHM